MGLSCFKSWKHDSAGHKGNRDVLASPGSYFFLSNSAGQGDEWLKSLNKGVWIPFTGVFGQSLEETVLYERRYGVRLVPLVVEQCVAFIRERGLHEVGLFRQPGQTSLVKELQEAFDSGERPSFDSGTDVHTVASLLKLYLRQLPEPLVPYSRYQDFLLCGQKVTTDRTMGLLQLRILLHELPVANFNLLNFICQFLDEVQSYSSSNKMGIQNLATVFGPNILRAKTEDPQSIMGGAGLVQSLMSELIREHSNLFSKVPPPLSANQAASSCAAPSALMQPHLQPPPCLRQLSLPLIADSPERDEQPTTHADMSSSIFSAAVKSDTAQRRCLGHRYTSSHPENCFNRPLSSSQLQPDRNYMEYDQHHDGQGPSHANIQADLQLHIQEPESSRSVMTKGWGNAWSGQQESAVWSSDGTEEEDFAVQETASRVSSEGQEGSTPSAYDNLDRASLCQAIENVTVDENEADYLGGHTGNCEAQGEQDEKGETRHSSLWSSCEILPFDEGSDIDRAVSPEILPKRRKLLLSSKDAEIENKDKDNNNDNVGDLIHPNSPVSCSALSGSPLSTGSSEVFLPPCPPSLLEEAPPSGSKDTHTLVAKLQQQVSRQKAEYQTRIERLERSNDSLERQVAVLRLSLEQQRRCQSVAEIKIRNIERAKADADRRNSSLQREMELFFQMCGEIRARSSKGARGGGSI